MPGPIQVAESVIHDDTEHGVEDLTVSQILARSSNVGTIEIAAKLGPNGLPNGLALRVRQADRRRRARRGIGLTLKVTEFSGPRSATSRSGRASL